MAPLIGQSVSHFKILEQLGAGGMGVVYKAQDLLLKRDVALKFLPPGLTQDSRTKARFFKEARAASALDHPNICTIFEIGETAEGQVFIAMACYGGETLAHHMRRGTLSFEDISRIICQIASGLAAAHRKGIVHRDLNPSNIMITTDGIVKVLDFGLAKLAGQARTTSDGTTVGTAPYMSPEQVMGKDVDASTDIWSLGVIAYELVCGTLPFRGDHAPAQMYSITNEAPLPIEQFRQGAPGVLTSVIDGCLQKESSRRTLSMEDIVRLLDPNRSGIASPASGGRAVVRRRLLVAIVALVVIAGGVFLVAQRRPRPTGDTAQPSVKVGILPFSSQTGDSLAGRWSLLIQSMLVAHLTGSEHIGIVPPGTIASIEESQAGGPRADRGRDLITLLREHANVTYLVEGTIARADAGYRIQADLIHSADGNARFSAYVTASRESDLERSIPDLGEKLYDFLEFEELHASTDESLRPWFRERACNVEAEKLFLEASDLLYRGESGSAALLERALRIDSTFISPRVWLVSGLVGIGRRDEARRHYRILCSLRANAFEQAMIQWCGADIQGDVAGEIRALNAALQYSPGNNILILNLAEAYDELGDTRTALDVLAPALDTQWHFAWLYSDAAHFYVKLGRYDQAAEVLEKAIGIGISRAEVSSMLSALALARGDTAGADRYAALAIRQFHSMDNREQLLEFMLGSDLLSTGSYAVAEDHFRKALRIDPSVPSYRSGLADALYYTGDFDGARREFTETLRIDSTWVYAHFMLGLLDERNNDIQAAAQHFAAFLLHQPTGRIADTVQHHLSRIGARS